MSLLLFAVPGPVGSAGADPLADACRGAMSERALFSGINDEGSLAIFYETGPQGTDSLRLADIGASPLIEVSALRDALRPWIGRPVVVYPIDKRRDRWQRRVAHVESVADEGQWEPVWLQKVLVQAGLVEVRPEGTEPGCARALYRGERRARAAKRGLWRNGGLRILSARDGELGAHAGAYRIVAGIVVSVGVTLRKLYLNFGRDWSRDFTVTIPAARASAFRAAGRDLDAMVGRYIRVRGWLRRWNGAVIDV
ncbi:hypothetical protein [Breoghania sp.]|uniref:thermonuclease family protein n=1 Tax=Breoghania sp. TaxID=2065378 RepID=UPI0026371099|nr:hypothetical protein [Breoghania sp.]MDJ0932640.1 hypothetical protein [Breoghania sp.]